MSPISLKRRKTDVQSDVFVAAALGTYCGKNGEAGPGPGDRMPGLGKVCSADGWCWENPLPHGNGLTAVWGTDANNVWAVGSGVMKWDGTDWSGQSIGASTFNAVWGTDANNIWAVGSGVMKWDGTAWTAQPSEAKYRLSGVWGMDANNIWAVGGFGTIVRWDGTAWVAQFSRTVNSLLAVWGTDANNVWAVGDKGTMVSRNSYSSTETPEFSRPRTEQIL